MVREWKINHQNTIIFQITPMERFREDGLDSLFHFTLMKCFLIFSFGKIPWESREMGLDSRVEDRCRNVRLSSLKQQRNFWEENHLNYFGHQSFMLAVNEFRLMDPLSFQCGWFHREWEFWSLLGWDSFTLIVCFLRYSLKAMVVEFPLECFDILTWVCFKWWGL